ncbi:bifunctional metallophosphatase/5'-nucleotidase [Amphibacillus marinus]|nr:bifunctional UDP-sugar hydrolase/5'-nucleotidase [Amphibacillus marinus]
MQEAIYLYFTSDLHSHFENWPKLISFFNQQAIERRNRGESYFLLDNGDHLDRVHVATEAFKGKNNIELLNEANYRVVTIGNNEGITFNRDQFFSLYDQANFEVVCANLNSENSHNPAWLKPFKIISTPSQIKVAVIGLTAPFTSFYQPLGWSVTDPIKSLARSIAELQDQADIIVLLSHLGIDQDERIAEQFPAIDVIVGGHTHHLFKEGKQLNQSLLTAVGKFGHYAGEIMLKWDHNLKQVVKKEAFAVPIETMAEDEATLALLNTQQTEANQLMETVIAEMSAPLEVNWFKETPLIQGLTATLLEWTAADLAMLNAGILIDSLPAGAITEFDVHRICPHPINPCTVELTGSELLELIREGMTEAYINTIITGFGFRGKIMGKLVYANVEIELEAQQLIKSVKINQQPLIKSKIYTLATADMFTFGQLAPPIARSSSKRFFMPEFMRDLLRQTLQVKLN